MLKNNKTIKEIAKQLRKNYKENRFSSPPKLVRLYNNVLLDLTKIKGANEQDLFINRYVKQARKIYNENGKSMRTGKESILIHAGSTSEHTERVGCWLFSFTPFRINGVLVGLQSKHHSKDRNGRESIPVYCFHAGMPLDKPATPKKHALGLDKNLFRRIFCR
ncbi:MAG: hypothetical protein DRO67_04540 [Candidatus Asgardarchaeum californiense]|nr:MAG: hypothetical protein DRO67_04540 [Candidatus Asgardarchaeum californiense]